MDDINLRVLDDDDGEPVRLPEPEPRGNVDMTMRLIDGTVLRVATSGERARLTIAGPDGMATALLSELDAEGLVSILDRATSDIRRTKRGF
jgi:hypothetical protein